MFPAILGHEGAGVVLECGPGVTSLKPGIIDPAYTPECRTREYCLNPKTNLCQAIRETQGRGVMPDGTSRFSMLDGTPILHYMGALLCQPRSCLKLRLPKSTRMRHLIKFVTLVAGSPRALAR